MLDTSVDYIPGPAGKIITATFTRRSIVQYYIRHSVSTQKDLSKKYRGASREEGLAISGIEEGHRALRGHPEQRVESSKKASKTRSRG
jgi:hypothetical protein